MICNSCKLLLLWLLTFLLGKLAFMALCHGAEAMSLEDVGAVLWHGLPMDVSTTAYLLLPPWLCGWVTLNWPRAWRWLRPVLTVLLCVAAVTTTACIVGDIALYPFWGFKLDATIWTYIDSPKDAVASVSTAFIVLHAAAFLAAAVLLCWMLSKVIPIRQEAGCPRPHWLLRCGLFNLLYALLGGILFIALRGGVTESTMNVGNAYFSDRQFLNHAAINPAFSLLASSQKAEHFDRLYRSMPPAEADSLLAGLYPISGKPNDPAPDAERPTLLRTERPNLLLLFWESCGGQFTACLGGPTGEAAVTPCLDSLAREGILFTELRANSFRTDRGTLSTLSGHLSYPTHSLMKMATRASHLPSIARSLADQGYHTAFSYGGDINFTNMKGYLLGTGFQRITADTDFSRAERNSAKWGVCDSIFLRQLFDDLNRTPAPWFHAALTLSSHEPWDVPASYRRPADTDEKVAAFRYTDHHLGLLLRRLQASPLWDNLLVILLPDHGVLAGSVTSWQDPRFFHIPMIWTGGAVNAATTIPVLMNQSDLAATLLAQLGLSHDDFPWSRDVLSASYRRPLAYSTFNDAFCITSASGTTVLHDNKSQRSTVSGDIHEQDSLTRLGKAILQYSYDQLEQLH